MDQYHKNKLQNFLSAFEQFTEFLLQGEFDYNDNNIFILKKIYENMETLTNQFNMFQNNDVENILEEIDQYKFIHDKLSVFMFLYLWNKKNN